MGYKCPPGVPCPDLSDFNTSYQNFLNSNSDARYLNDCIVNQQTSTICEEVNACITGSTGEDTYVVSGTTNGKTLTLTRNDGESFDVSGFTNTTTFQKTDVPNTYDSNGDIFIPDYTSNSLTQGSVHYIANFAGGTVQALVINDVTSANQMTSMVGIALTTDPADGILIRGIINVGSNVGTTPGEPIYITGTGGLSSTAPSGSGEYVRVAGYYLAGNKVFFNPSQDFILLT